MVGKRIVCRLLALAAVAGSAAALVDSLGPRPLFCALESDCQSVTHSDFGRPLGVPLPVVGLAAFISLYLLSFFAQGRRARLLDAACVLAGFAGLGLLLVQFLVLKRVCRICLGIDFVALLLALVALAWPNRTESPPQARRFGWRGAAWGGLLVLAVAAPLAWGYLAPEPSPPPQVLALQKPDRLVVVVVTDFTCAHCRATHPALREALEEWGGEYELVLLTHCRSSSTGSEESARAYACAVAQGRGEAMAELLFQASDHADASHDRIATQAGLDLERFRSCRSASRTGGDLDCNRWVESIGAAGLPVVWVGKRRLVGAQTRASISAALPRLGTGR